jgi:hypothetical protein
MSVASKRHLTLALLFATLAVPAHAQDVQYSSFTKVDLGGGMNTVMKLAGVSEVRETTSIKGKKRRSDADKQSTIFDLDNSRYIVIDNSARTYMSVPLSDMARVATSSVRGMKADNSSDKLKNSRRSAGNKADFVVDIKVDPTGERRTVNGTTLSASSRWRPTCASLPGRRSRRRPGRSWSSDTWNANTGPAADAARMGEGRAKEPPPLPRNQEQRRRRLPGNPGMSKR